MSSSSGSCEKELGTRGVEETQTQTQAQTKRNISGGGWGRTPTPEAYRWVGGGGGGVTICSTETFTSRIKNLATPIRHKTQRKTQNATQKPKRNPQQFKGISKTEPKKKRVQKTHYSSLVQHQYRRRGANSTRQPAGRMCGVGGAGRSAACVRSGDCLVVSDLLLQPKLLGTKTSASYLSSSLEIPRPESYSAAPRERPTKKEKERKKNKRLPIKKSSRTPSNGCRVKVRR